MREQTNEVLRTFARWCALSVVHNWDCPEIVLRYLKTGDESIRQECSNIIASSVVWPSKWSEAKDLKSISARHSAWLATVDNIAYAARYAASSAIRVSEKQDEAVQEQRNKLKEIDDKFNIEHCKQIDFSELCDGKLASKNASIDYLKQIKIQ